MDFQSGQFQVEVEQADPSSARRDPGERRSEPRYEGQVDCATLTFRGVPYVVPVVNISSRGTMIESDLEPRLGETVIIRFAGCSPIQAFVRWSREGRMGLNFGCEMVLGG